MPGSAAGGRGSRRRRVGDSADWGRACGAPGNAAARLQCAPAMQCRGGRAAQFGALAAVPTRHSSCLSPLSCSPIGAGSELQHPRRHRLRSRSLPSLALGLLSPPLHATARPPLPPATGPGQASQAVAGAGRRQGAATGAARSTNAGGAAAPLARSAGALTGAAPPRHGVGAVGRAGTRRPFGGPGLRLARAPAGPHAALLPRGGCEAAPMSPRDRSVNCRSAVAPRLVGAPRCTSQPPLSPQGFGRLDLIDFHEDVRAFQEWPPPHFATQASEPPPPLARCPPPCWLASCRLVRGPACPAPPLPSPAGRPAGSRRLRPRLTRRCCLAAPPRPAIHPSASCSRCPGSGWWPTATRGTHTRSSKHPSQRPATARCVRCLPPPAWLGLACACWRAHVQC